ncbi:MAG: rRNA maturation RNase YbeY [Candidatus Paceibacterota bacterium]|jgi:probable rRNA maturation factor
MVEINNLSKKYRKIDKNFLKKVAQKILKAEGVKSNEEISIAIIDSLEIKKLNKQYRKKNRPTDVLSFGKVREEIAEIVICPEEVEKNGKDFKKELIEVLIHGVLHLLSYDHEKKKSDAEVMFKKQKEYLSKVKF